MQGHQPHLGHPYLVLDAPGIESMTAAGTLIRHNLFPALAKYFWDLPPPCLSGGKPPTSRFFTKAFPFTMDASNKASRPLHVERVNFLRTDVAHG